MARILIGNWWALALRGVVAILFAAIAFLWPAITDWTLILLFAAYALVDGVFAIVAAVRAAAHHGRSWPLLLEGIVDLAAAAVAFLWPGLTLLILIYVIAIWAIVTGVALIVAGFTLRRLHGEWLLVLSGVVSVLFGVMLVLQPITGAVVLAWWIGLYALLFGITLLAVAFRLRRIGMA
ncbi:MAG: HdeD family acid-resistance protein [Alphaproteobacteria bacterium]|nr:HdeD family acid-resistance protein [Alphaproteobacteria bacterium]